MNHRHHEVLEEVQVPYVRGPSFPEKDWAFFIKVLFERRAQDAEFGGPAHDDCHTYQDWLCYIHHQIGSVLCIPGTPGELDAAMLEGTNLADYESRMVKVAALAMAAAQSVTRKVEAALQNLPKQSKSPSDLLVLAPNFTSRPQVDGSLLRESCDKFSLNLLEYGIGRPMPTWKQAKIVEPLEILRGRSESFAMLVDAHDSFVAGDEEDILQTYLQTGASVLVSAEKNCWPRPSEAVRYAERRYTSSPWTYVNAGGFIGRRSDLIEVLTYLVSIPDDDDQGCWTTAYLELGHGILLDDSCSLFQTMYGYDPIELEPGSNLIWGTRPLVWHFNGKDFNYPQGKPDMREWYRRTA